MQSDARVPNMVRIDTGQGEGTTFMPWQLAEKIPGLRGYRAPNLHATCGECEAEIQARHVGEEKEPLLLRLGGGKHHIECQDCRDKRQGGGGTDPDTGPVVYRLLADDGEPTTDPDTGELLTFSAADSDSGALGALHRAARAAGRLQKTGETVLLVGPDVRRRYDPEYLQHKGAKRWPYRVACANYPECGHWTHPSRPGRRCESCYAASDAARENGLRLLRMHADPDADPPATE